MKTEDLPMTATDGTILKIRQRLEEACTKNDCVLLPGILMDAKSLPSVVLAEQEFSAAIQAERPRAVFYRTIIFDIDRIVMSECDDRGLSVDVDPAAVDTAPVDVRLTEFKQRLQALAEFDQFQGAESYVEAFYVSGGLMRLFSVTADWRSNIEDRVCELLDGEESDNRLHRTQRYNESVAENQRALEPLAREVSQHPLFLATRGLAKRYSVVWELFANRIPPHPDGERVSRAIEHVPGANVNLEYLVRMAQHFEKTADINHTSAS